MRLRKMLLASAILATPAMAQNAAPVAAQGGLQDIVVTAQRREENLQKAALAVSAVAGDTLVKQSITQATDLSRLVPALQVAPAASFTQIYMRGIGSFGANAFAEQGVAFNLDGIYLSRPAAPAALFYDLERIEALKGPQGTLYGRNASGGALNLITAKPKLGETSGFVNAEYGNYNAFKTSAAINLPLGEQWAARVSGQYARHDGYMSDGYDDENTGALRGQLKFDNRAGINATLMLDYGHVGGRVRAARSCRCWAMGVLVPAIRPWWRPIWRRPTARAPDRRQERRVSGQQLLWRGADGQCRFGLCHADRDPRLAENGSQFPILCLIFPDPRHRKIAAGLGRSPFGQSLRAGELGCRGLLV
jgi:outer membrane receptor protein involved in Fe transport